ncbi:UNVERIFIED_CONTAM: hypothetical protein HDU68_008137 [Siphonaria sp. JEL0065]|nr:hypothetical protein HDU68_008137 [Siphonaria sp. JEL0065]
MSESDYDSDESDIPPWHEELPKPPTPPPVEPIVALKSKKTLLDAVTCRKSPLYDNCKLLAQNGVDLMAMISRKRYNWYLKKGIAAVVDEVWAKASGTMRTALAKEYNAPVNGIILVNENEGSANDNDSIKSNSTNNTVSTMSAGSLASAKSAAKALIKMRAIPSDRKQTLLYRVALFLEKENPDDITEEDLKTLADTPVNHLVSKDRIKTHEQIVVEAFRGREQELVEKWRSLFLKECNPQHLPEFWDVHFVKPAPFMNEK